MGFPSGGNPMKITVENADITRLDVDAIVNAANAHGILGGGVAGAIKKAGGKTIEDEARAMAPVRIGQAIRTTSGTLPCKAVIHAPTMTDPGEQTSPTHVYEATTAALALARREGFRRVAIPGLGTGVGGVRFEEAAHSIVRAVLDSTGEGLEEIMLVDINDEMVAAFRAAYDDLS
jgi:O-acetyl-ADP-ribose deacetylase (regulator of RNase III)